MSDFVGIEAAAKTLADALNSTVPKIENAVSRWITETTTLATTTTTAIGVTVNGVFDNFFEKLTLLSQQYKLPVQIIISKPKSE